MPEPCDTCIEDEGQGFEPFVPDRQPLPLRRTVLGGLLGSVLVALGMRKPQEAGASYYAYQYRYYCRYYGCQAEHQRRRCLFSDTGQPLQCEGWVTIGYVSYNCKGCAGCC